MSSLPDCSEYLVIIDTPSLLKSNILQGGRVAKRNGTTIRYVGGYCVVFPFETPHGKYAVRCWHASLNDMQSKVKKISEELDRLNLPYFVNFQYDSDGVASTKGIQPIVVMDWVDAQPLKSYIGNNINDAQKLNRLADEFLEMTLKFHAQKISHGDLQHGNILVRNDGSIVLVDYDSMYVPGLDGCEEEIKGLEGYQPECRWKNKMLTPKADYFSEMVIYVSLKALVERPELWRRLNMEDTETMLFSAEDIKSKGSSEIFSTLESIESIKPIIDGMKEAMTAGDINDIKPLKSILHANDDIRKKWKDNGWTKSEPINHQIETEEIKGKWCDSGYKAPEPSNPTKIADGIRKKW